MTEVGERMLRLAAFANKDPRTRGRTAVLLAAGSQRAARTPKCVGGKMIHKSAPK